MFEYLITNYNYMVVVFLMMMGLWAMIAKKNLVKKCIGLVIFQTGIILFYISMGAKNNSTIPIIDPKYGEAAINYANPLTQILMLTAIVVGVATLGVGLMLVQRIYKEYGSINEDRILEKFK
ncbi:NADH-quinone oxidoreductase subunit J [Candidatus Marinamargulisbacteria bacterium SCGC AG-410-N11]|nr:NADH-quinone oxidoreductase subunit J [Candidatus Marinamargulisbacteria bacterium SCGC AG-410-N11]